MDGREECKYNTKVLSKGPPFMYSTSPFVSAKKLASSFYCRRAENFNSSVNARPQDAGSPKDNYYAFFHHLPGGEKQSQHTRDRFTVFFL
jgi:hypothetical protein